MAKNNTLSIEYFNELRFSIEDGLTHVSIEPHLTKKDVCKIARENGSPNLTSNKLTYMVDQGLITPHIVPGDGRDTHLYGRHEIVSIILVQVLREKKYTYTQIANLLRMPQDKQKKSQMNEVQPPEVGLPPQGKRGQITLNSRVLTVLLNHILDKNLVPGTILHLRERKAPNRVVLPEGVAQLSSTVMGSVLDADNYVGHIRENDLTAYISPEPDREVLFSPTLGEKIPDFGNRDWLLISVKIGQPVKQYDLMIGLTGKEILERVKIPTNNLEANILGLLMRIVFLKTQPENLPEKKPPENGFNRSTLLNSLVNFVPEISDLWEYSAVLTASIDVPQHLQIAAVSRDFPKDLRQEINNIIIEPGQPLAGWVFNTTYPVCVQHTAGIEDPRLAYQRAEQATSATAIPTRAREDFNGVLYVGTRFQIPEGVQPFSEAEIRVLHILANIIGEIVERNRIRRFSEDEAFQIIDLAPITYFDWNVLEDSIRRTIESIRDLKEEPIDEDNLHVTIVKVDAYPEMHRKSPTVANWVLSHIVETTRTFFIRNGIGNPKIFLHRPSSQMKQASEFVCLFPNIQITDDFDQDLRNRLRSLLCSMSLSFSYEESYRIDTKVWSMPFRYKGLKNRFHQFEESSKALDTITSSLVTEIEEALVIIPYIERGHQYEDDMAYPKALEQYRAAHYLAKNNRYIQRHIAKMYSAIGEFKDSVKWWKLVLQTEKHQSHYIRLAHVLARMGDIPQAMDTYRRAFELDSTNPKILLEWGDLLAINGDLKGAINQYNTALGIEKANRDTLWLRLADVYLEQGDFESARAFTKLVLDRNPDNQEAKRLILTILKREKG